MYAWRDAHFAHFRLLGGHGHAREARAFVEGLLRSHSARERAADREGQARQSTCGEGRPSARGELTLPMRVTESGMVTLVSFVQSKKAPCESRRACVCGRPI